MQFNPDPKKQANEVTFSRKSDSGNVLHPPIKFNNNSYCKISYSKTLRNCVKFKIKFQFSYLSKNLKM